MKKTPGRVQDETLFASIDATPIATVITDPHIHDNPIVAANDAFCVLTGYTINEVLGRNCRFLNAQGTEPIPRATLRRAVAEARPVLVELTNYRKDSTAFRNAVMIAPLLGDGGSVDWFVGSQMDVTDRAASLVPPRPEVEALIAQLSTRQLQVLEFMVAGYRNKQIGGFLNISEKTVKMHRKALLVRLNAPTSADAIRIGVESGLARPGNVRA